MSSSFTNKKRVTLWLDRKAVRDAKEVLDETPKTSYSKFIESKLLMLVNYENLPTVKAATAGSKDKIKLTVSIEPELLEQSKNILNNYDIRFANFIESELLKLSGHYRTFEGVLYRLLEIENEKARLDKETDSLKEKAQEINNCDINRVNELLDIFREQTIKAGV